MVKIDPSSLSVAEFRIMFILAKSDLALNSYEINKELLRTNLDFFDMLTEATAFKAQTMDWNKFSSMFGSLREILNFVAKILEDQTIAKGDNKRMKKLMREGDVKSLRQCEKIMRQYIEMPTVERITRILTNLEKEDYVIKREIGKRESVWSLPNDVKNAIIEHSEKIKKTKEKEFEKLLTPCFEMIQRDLSQKPLSSEC